MNRIAKEPDDAPPPQPAFLLPEERGRLIGGSPAAAVIFRTPTVRF
jgi:hypothetical protein